MKRAIYLLDATFSDGRFDFVGNDGWQGRDGSRATFGQQPIEAGYTAQACTLAYEVTGDERYLERARAAVEWLLGRNRLGIALYDPATGRCADGLDRTEPATTPAASPSPAPSSASSPFPRRCPRTAPRPRPRPRRPPDAGAGGDAGPRGVAGAAPPLRALGARRLPADGGPGRPGRRRDALRHRRLDHLRPPRRHLPDPVRGGRGGRRQGGRVPPHRLGLRAGG
jgi:hypothetical protein